ncbi:hypothetical protein BCh11DRAFT_02244 [Burkholderia sp. Ch1-1]|nr:hypothetical protein BCh11DRAFT_02244 [Burkholderia sp. Ch1-1]
MHDQAYGQAHQRTAFASEKPWYKFSWRNKFDHRSVTRAQD